MPLKERRNLSVQHVCQRPECGVLFHPWRGREATQAYCSRDCSRAAGVYTQLGTWPTLTAPVPTTNRDGNQTPHTDHATAPALPYDPEREVREWREEGKRLAALASTLERIGAARRREGRTVTLGGRGAWVGVEHDALVLASGRTYGAPGTRAVFHRALHDLAAVVITEPAVTLTGSALLWCRSEGVALGMLDTDGAVLAALVPPPDKLRDDVALRRRQHTLTPDEHAHIARHLLMRKLMAQQATLMAHPELPGRDLRMRALDVLETGLHWLALPDPPPWLSDMAVLRTLEARCARGYFGVWVGLPLRFARADMKRVPPHWLAVRERSSPLSPTGSGRHAVDPANAILNYAYGCLEAEARQALTVQGFDLAAGFLHADKPGRDSLVFDLMESARGAVDALVLAFLGRTTLHAASFSRVGDGGVRLHPQLARAVVAACRAPQDQLDEHARWLRSALLNGMAEASMQDPKADLCSAVS
jgi:CRISP-associated protein Cas1